MCAKCGSPLEPMFHRHHKNENHADNSVENLELHCASCHRATLGAAIDAHRAQEAKALSAVNDLITKALEGKIAGAVVERLTDAISLSLKISRTTNDLDKGLEHFPPHMLLAKRLVETDELKNIYLKGFVDGIQAKGGALIAESSR